MLLDSAEQLPTPTTSKAPPGNTMLKSNSSKNTLSTKGIPEVKPSAAVSNEADNLAQMQHIGKGRNVTGWNMGYPILCGVHQHKCVTWELKV